MRRTSKSGEAEVALILGVTPGRPAFGIACFGGAPGTGAESASMTTASMMRKGYQRPIDGHDVAAELAVCNG